MSALPQFEQRGALSNLVGTKAGAPHADPFHFRSESVLDLLSLKRTNNSEAHRTSHKPPQMQEKEKTCRYNFFQLQAVGQDAEHDRLMSVVQTTSWGMS